jgi:hypothetical protein
MTVMTDSGASGCAVRKFNVTPPNTTTTRRRLLSRQRPRWSAPPNTDTSQRATTGLGHGSGLLRESLQRSLELLTGHCLVDRNGALRVLVKSHAAADRML